MGSDDWVLPLQQLTRKPPSEGPKTAVLDAMRGEMGDRAAALVMAALADAALLGLIAYQSRLDQAQFKEKFYNSRGEFSNFYKRIEGAFHLNLVGPNTKANATVIRNVRNVFAHALSDVDFSAVEIVNACQRLKLSDRNKFFIDHEETRKTRHMFGYACNEIYSGVLNYVGIRWIHGQSTDVDSPILP